jgi:hypothetical protein
MPMGKGFFRPGPARREKGLTNLLSNNNYHSIKWSVFYFILAFRDKIIHTLLTDGMYLG